MTVPLLPEHDVAGASCPACHEQLDAATGVDHGEKPSAGALSICFYCGAPLRFTSPTELQIIDKEELPDIERAHPLFARLRFHILFKLETTGRGLT